MHVKSFVFNSLSENTYILYKENGNAFLIDPGNSNSQETKVLEDFISEKRLHVKNILLTHAHIDHIFGLQWAYETLKVPIFLHPEEKEILDLAPLFAQYLGISFFEPFSGDVQFINEGDRIELDGSFLYPYHTPGHSPGSVSYHNPDEKFVISGDVLFRGSIGRTDLYKGDHEVLLKGIRTKLFSLDVTTRVFSGHGSATDIGFEKKFNPFFQ